MQDNVREKVKCQIQLQQVEEELRKVHGQLGALEVQARQYHQEYNRAEMNMHEVEEKLRNLKNTEFSLNQKVMAAKKALLDCSRNG